MDRFLLFVNAAYLGLGAFFSFYVAPILFRVLQKEQAGDVVERVFPVYFSLGLLVCLLTLVLGLRVGNPISILALVNGLVHAIHVFYILPKAHNLKLLDYEAFMKWHGLSMGMNLLSLLLTLIICLLLIRR